MVTYGYGLGLFIAWYGGNHLRAVHLHKPRDGSLQRAYWTMISCNVISAAAFLVPQDSALDSGDVRDL